MKCSPVGHMVEDQIGKVKDMAIKVLMKGWFIAWRQQDIIMMRDECGTLSGIVFGRVGGSVPDRKGENKELLISCPS